MILDAVKLAAESNLWTAIFPELMLGCLALLLLALEIVLPKKLHTLLPDIGGPVRPRLRTSVEILVGSVIAAFFGALVADQPVALVAAMFVVAFAAAYIGVLSPYLAAAGTSVLLVFLLSGGSPTDEVSVALHSAFRPPAA